MSWYTAFLVFAVIWWTVIFAILPLGVRRTDDPVRGTDRGAPERPDLKRKAMITTAIAAVFWVLWYVVWVLDVFDWRAGG
jgi:predicted secreted protein